MIVVLYQIFLNIFVEKKTSNLPMILVLSHTDPYREMFPHPVKWIRIRRNELDSDLKHWLLESDQVFVQYSNPNKFC